MVHSAAIGLQLYSFRDRLRADFDGTLATVARMGFTEVEVPELFGHDAASFRKSLDRAGLHATSMMVGYDKLSHDLPGAIADARTLGVGFVGCAWIQHDDGAGLTPDQAARALEDFRRWGAALRGERLRFFFHFHSYEFRPGSADRAAGSRGSGNMDAVVAKSATNASRAVDAFLAGTTNGEVDFEEDVFWFARAGVDPTDYLRQYPGRFPLLHLKDLARGAAVGDTTGHAPVEAFVPVGTGVVNWAEVLRAAKASGVEHYYIEDESADPMGSVAKSLAYLRKVQ